MAVNCNPSDLVNAARCFSCIPKSARRAVRAYLLCNFANRFAIDPVVMDWVNRVMAHGGATPSENTITAANTFYMAIKNGGLLPKVIALNMVVPDSLIACLTPLIVGPGFDPWINHFYTSAAVSVNGLTGIGGGGFIETGLIPANIFSQTSAGCTVYVSSAYNPAAPLSSELGAYNVGGNVVCELAVVDTANNLYWASWNFNGAQGAVIVPNAAAVTGFISGNRTAANASTIYQANSSTPFGSIGSVAAGGGTVATVNLQIYFMARNQSGVTIQASTKTVSFAAVHLGFTSSEAQLLFNAVQNLRVSLGGGFV